MTIPSTIYEELDGHDVLFETSDGQKIGCMLVRPPKEAKGWAVGEIPAPENLRVTLTGVGSQDFPPEMAAATFRRSNHEGMRSRVVDNLQNDYMSGLVQTSVVGKVLKPPGNEEISLPSSEGAVRDIIEFENSAGVHAIFCSDGRYLHRSTNGVLWSEVLDVGAGNRISDLETFGATDGNPYLLVCVEVAATGAAVNYYYSSLGTSGSFTQRNTADGSTARFMFVRDDTLVGLIQPNILRTVQDPTNAGTWSGPTEVGDQQSGFQGGITIAARLVIFKEDRVFTIDAAGGVSTLIAQFERNAGPWNFQTWAAGFNSNLYMWIDAELWEYDPVTGEMRPLNLRTIPDTLIETVGGTRGGIAYDNVGLYVIHETTLSLPDGSLSAGTSIIRMVLDRDGIPIYERWFQQTPQNGYRAQGPLHFSQRFAGATGRALYCSSTTAGRLIRIHLPRAADPKNDSNAIYDLTPSVLRTGWIDHNFPAQAKDYTTLVLGLNGVTSTPPRSTVDVYYYLDNDETTRHTLITGLSSVGHDQVHFEGITANSIMLEFVLLSDADVKSPEIATWALFAAVKFELREVIELAVRIMDHPLTRNGTESPHTANELRNALRGIRTRRGITISYKDYRGFEFNNVRVLPGIGEQDIWSEGHIGAHEEVMTLRVLRVTAPVTGVFVVGEDIVGGSAVIGP